MAYTTAQTTARPSIAMVAKRPIRSADDELPACTSNGDPPPESWFDLWGVAVVVGAGGDAATLVSNVICGCMLVAVDTGCSVEAALLVVPDADVEGALDTLDALSVASAEVDSAVLGLAVVEGWACVLVGGDAGACVELFPIVVTCTLGHTAGTPAPSMKTPMMDVSGTSTLAHCLVTVSAILTRPWTHCALQRASLEKSLA
jgi:hypothetical protein